MALKDNLQRLRKNANLSQEDLSEITGIHKNQISKLERGETTEPLASTIMKLARALGCSMDEMMYDDAKHGPDDEFRWLFEELQTASPKRREIAKEMLKSILLVETQERITRR